MVMSRGVSRIWGKWGAGCFTLKLTVNFKDFSQKGGYACAPLHPLLMSIPLLHQRWILVVHVPAVFYCWVKLHQKCDNSGYPRISAKRSMLRGPHALTTSTNDVIITTFNIVINFISVVLQKGETLAYYKCHVDNFASSRGIEDGSTITKYGMFRERVVLPSLQAEIIIHIYSDMEN
jgi:hypothetical protein